MRPRRPIAAVGWVVVAVPRYFRRPSLQPGVSRAQIRFEPIANVDVAEGEEECRTVE